MVCFQPRTPPHESVNPSETNHIQWLRVNEGLFRFANLQFFRDDGNRLWQPVFRRFGTSLSSHPVRYGYILYSLYKQKKGINNDHCRANYLSLFYNSTNEAISRNDLASLVYGCFAGCMYLLRTDCDFQEVEKHAKGYLTSLSRLSVSDTNEKFLLECMTEKMLWEGAKRFLFNADWSTSNLAPVTKFLEDFFLTWKLKENEPGWMKESSLVLNLKLKFVRTLIQLYHCRHHFENAEVIKKSLLSRFRRDFVDPIEFRVLNHASYGNLAKLRSFLRALWSSLLDIVLDLVANSRAAETFDHRTETAVFAINSIIDLIPKSQDTNEFSTEVRNLIDIAGYCMKLVTPDAKSEIGFSCLASCLMR